FRRVLFRSPPEKVGAAAEQGLPYGQIIFAAMRTSYYIEDVASNYRLVTSYECARLPCRRRRTLYPANGRMAARCRAHPILAEAMSRVEGAAEGNLLSGSPLSSVRELPAASRIQ